MISDYKIKNILLRAIPSQGEALSRKQSYRSYPLLTDRVTSNEPLVNIADYGIAGQSYYSRPNPATGDPVANVTPEVHVRQSLAQLLADINTMLQQTNAVAELLDGEVELYVQEGWRSRQTQKLLYEEVFPRLIRKQHAGIPDAEMRRRRSELIAAPRGPNESPSPHETGAAIDVTLRYVSPDLGYTPRSLVYMGRKQASTGPSAAPDFYEKPASLTARALTACRNRRAFYWIMRGALLPEGDSRLVCNPTEYWHWSFGDQLWGALTQAPYAIYGTATVPEHTV